MEQTDTSWMENLSVAELEKERDLAWECSRRGNRLGMPDAYNYHRNRARAFEREIARREGTMPDCPQCARYREIIQQEKDFSSELARRLTKAEREIERMKGTANDREAQSASPAPQLPYAVQG